ncbi:hypothetical protein [Streptomyces cavernicola]|uniref:Uncharacterized protein n=1 Tax=Streptomyces cavernicola TaxID=3043613 RepID=A0ABT6S601_9ACTN|nr:hypothetical protein [Streptomyces sp. B-S-A6]MDI3402848.1 hypothetical protein [Streptomyces sp. B-S-A6]
MGNKLLSEPVWRLISDSPSVAEEFGRSTLSIVIAGPEAIGMEMKLWDSRGLAHHCDGRVFLSPSGRAGSRCGCPPLMAERKERARFGQGPQPVTTVLFRLVGEAAQDAAMLRFRSSSWRFAETVEALRADLARVHGPALCELTVESIEFTTRNGRRVAYYKPAVKVRGPWSLDLAA